MVWKIDDAQLRLGEVVRLALSEGPQRIDRSDSTRESVMVISESAYRAMAARPPAVDPLAAFLTSPGGPSFEGLDLGRDQSGMRELEL